MTGDEGGEDDEGEERRREGGWRGLAGKPGRETDCL